MTSKHWYHMAAQPMEGGGDIGLPVEIPRVTAEGATVRACLLQMAVNLAPIVGQVPAWDFTLGVGERARDISREYLYHQEEAPFIGDAIHSEQVDATGPFYLGAQPCDEADDERTPTTPGWPDDERPPTTPDGNPDREFTYGGRLMAQGGTLRECFLEMADVLVARRSFAAGSVVDELDCWDMTLDVGNPPGPGWVK